VSYTAQTRIRFGLLLAAAWLAVSPIRGQETTDVAPAPSARFPAAWYPPDNDVTSTMAPVKGAPYEARIIMAGQRPGLPIEQEPLQARDGAGRQRTETLQIRLDRDGRPITVRDVEVSDPVTHCGFRWIEPWVDKSEPTATVSCMPRTLHYGAKPMWASVASMQVAEEHPSSTETDHNEPLGERIFGGVRATGVRHTRIIQTAPTDNPQTMVTEFWVSTEMKELVAMYQEFPDGFSMELREIQLREPDAGLFYPPANYKIKPTSAHP
jgi:hypothetical protein